MAGMCIGLPLTLLLFANIGNPVSSLQCLSCNGVISTVLCHTVRTCQEGETCLTEKYTTVNGEQLFNVGCVSKTSCVPRGKRSALDPAVSRVQCTECCNTDACNRLGCGEQDLTQSFGPLCYSCKQSLDPRRCSSVRTCRHNEACHIRSESELGFQYYVTSCMMRYSCQNTLPLGRRRRAVDNFKCCATDLCNNNINGTSVALPPLPTPGGGGSGIGVVTVSMTTKSTPVDIKAKDCKELLAAGLDSDGVYTIYPKGQALEVFCDMTTNNGGWTAVLIKSDNGTVLFNTTWDDYKAGFGHADSEFWLGNENIRTLAQLGKTDVYFKLIDKNDKEIYASWKNFSLGSESDGYKLTFDRLSYDGNAGNTLNNTNPWYTHYGMKFTTIDQDSDTYDAGNCARLTQGGWWFSGCYSVDPTAMSTRNFVWLDQNGYYQLKHVIMMLRRE